MKIMKAFDTILVALAVATTSLAVGGAARSAIAQSGDTGLSNCMSSDPNVCQNVGSCGDPSKSRCQTPTGGCCTPVD